MLSRAQRLTDSAGFAHTVKYGWRGGGKVLVIHLLPDPAVVDGPTRPTRVGFVVSKAVGDAVTRNQVKRRLRHLVREQSRSWPPGSVVVRALPAAAAASYQELGRELERCVQRCLPKSPPTPKGYGGGTRTGGAVR